MQETKPLLEQALSAFERAVQKTRRLELLSLAFVLLLPMVATTVALARFDVLWAIVVALGAWCGSLLWYLRRQPQWVSAAHYAHAAEGLSPELGAAARVAVDLHTQLKRDRDDAQFSVELATAHIESTGRHLGTLELHRRYQQQRIEYWKRRALAIALMVVLSVVVIVVMDKGRGRLLAFVGDPSAARFSDVPLAADIGLVYRYPQYTQLSTRTLEGTDGSISALAGTTVELRAITHAPVQEAWLDLEDVEGNVLRRITMKVGGGRVLKGTFVLARDGRYGFSVLNENGEHVRERLRRPVRAEADMYPEAYVDEPAGDIEIRDTENIDILWRVRDDFGVAAVNLVLTPRGLSTADRGVFLNKDPAAGASSTDRTDRPDKGVGGTTTDPKVKRIEILPDTASGSTPEKSLEGRYVLSFAQLSSMVSEDSVTVQVEVVDTDTVTGPKRSLSSPRRISLYSARRHHEQLLAEQREVLNAMVDWLAADLTAPVVVTATPDAAVIAKQSQIIAAMADLSVRLAQLIVAMTDDELSKPAVIQAFRNIGTHTNEAKRQRGRWVTGLTKRPGGLRNIMRGLESVRRLSVAQLEKDIVYLDDLLALQRIDELKSTAKDLLSAQRDLQALLEEYRNTQDPSLREELERRIETLRAQMLSLLSRMAAIKEHLPGEYRNMESASMLQMDDQLKRLQSMLAKGNLHDAARELEQLANMIENMVSRIDDAEEQYGGERYAELRKEVDKFSRKFKSLEAEQNALATRSEKMLAAYRKKAIERAGKDLDDVVRKARKLTARARKAAEQIQANGEPMLQESIEHELEALRDLDALLKSHDLSEARRQVDAALRGAQRIDGQLRDSLWNDPDFPGLRHAQESLRKATAAQRGVRSLLDKLFEQSDEVLSPHQKQQMRRMAQRQDRLQQEAQGLEQQMQKLSSEMPIFGEGMQESMQQARQEMGQSARALGEGDLPDGTAYGRRAADRLTQLRESLEQASKQRKGRRRQGQTMPMPFGGGSGGRGQGNSGSVREQTLHMPRAKPKPGFRQELLEAAKHKPAAGFEDAVQRYYKELIR